LSENLQKRLENLKNNEQYLSDWEKGFVESVTEQFNKRGNLSPRQLEFVVKFEEKISPESILAHQTWEVLYRDEKRGDAIIVAKYYQETGYFRGLATQILTEEDFIPTEAQWSKMCNNKYAKKVLAEHKAEAKYPNASLVQLRATADWRYSNSIGDAFCTVIQSGEQVGSITSAAKGAKLYKILPFGSSKVYTVEERHLKKARKSKTSKKVKKELDNEILF